MAMKELMYKEFKLSMHPIAYIFLSLSALLCIPNYPYYVTFFYTCLGIFFLFQGNRENRDVYYMMALPIRKRDIVKARFYLVVCIQMAQVIACIPFAFIRGLNPMNNQVGIEANVAFFGLAFVMLGLFNLVFLSQYYKSGYKIGIPFVLSSVVIAIYVIVVEVLDHIVPYMKTVCESGTAENMIKQIPVLIAGILLYSVITILAYKKSADSFEKLDL
jgi:hypothetical protein